VFSAPSIDRDRISVKAIAEQFAEQFVLQVAQMLLQAGRRIRCETAPPVTAIVMTSWVRCKKPARQKLSFCRGFRSTS
jgi:hypothetical protein